MVPTAKSLDAPPDPLSNGIDHFKCYRVVRARQRVAGIAIEDQFGALTVNVKRPSRLCVAVNKNQEGVSDLNSALMCYQVKQASRPRFTGKGPIFLANQFGHDTPLAVTRPTELCVPSTIGGPALCTFPEGGDVCLDQPACGDNPSCTGLLHDGGCFCHQGSSCGDLTACTADSECDPGWACAPSCCGETPDDKFCHPPCGTGGGGEGQGAGGKTSTPN